MNMIVNAGRTLAGMFPAYFNLSTKHDHYRDFGWPETLAFDQFYRMYTRNSLAAAGVDKTIGKTWQEYPEIWESEEPAESPIEAEIRQRFADIRLWRAASDADRRSMVGGYAGLILRLRDGKAFDQPVDFVPGGLDGLAEVIPAWASQLTVAEWDARLDSETYGKPLFYQFQESALGGGDNAPRQFRVHPDRVIIWSEDGTIDCASALEPGFNDLIDSEKIKGAGGEGFWKTSRGAPVIEAPEGMKPSDVAKAMGIDQKDLIDAINKQLDSFQAGFDKGLMLGGMTAKPLAINLPSPEHFLHATVSSYAASMRIPMKILMGSQTGERASTEDASEWAVTINGRRNNLAKPLIQEMVNRLEAFGIIPERDWTINWGDLTEATASERIDRAKVMADINSKAQPGDEPPFLPDEIREAAGYAAMEEVE